MEKVHEKEIRTPNQNILICKCREENGVQVLEFARQHKKDLITVNDFLRILFKD